MSAEPVALGVREVLGAGDAVDVGDGRHRLGAADLTGLAVPDLDEREGQRFCHQRHGLRNEGLHHGELGRVQVQLLRLLRLRQLLVVARQPRLAADEEKEDGVGQELAADGDAVDEAEEPEQTCVAASHEHHQSVRDGGGQVEQQPVLVQVAVAVPVLLTVELLLPEHVADDGTDNQEEDAHGHDVRRLALEVNLPHPALKPAVVPVLVVRWIVVRVAALRHLRFDLVADEPHEEVLHEGEGQLVAHPGADELAEEGVVVRRRHHLGELTQEGGGLELRQELLRHGAVVVPLDGCCKDDVDDDVQRADDDGHDQVRPRLVAGHHTVVDAHLGAGARHGGAEDEEHETHVENTNHLHHAAHAQPVVVVRLVEDTLALQHRTERGGGRSLQRVANEEHDVAHRVLQQHTRPPALRVNRLEREEHGDEGDGLDQSAVHGDVCDPAHGAFSKIAGHERVREHIDALGERYHHSNLTGAQVHGRVVLRGEPRNPRRHREASEQLREAPNVHDPLHLLRHLRLRHVRVPRIRLSVAVVRLLKALLLLLLRLRLFWLLLLLLLLLLRLWLLQLLLRGCQLRRRRQGRSRRPRQRLVGEMGRRVRRKPVHGGAERPVAHLHMQWLLQGLGALRVHVRRGVVPVRGLLVCRIRRLRADRIAELHPSTLPYPSLPPSTEKLPGRRRGETTSPVTPPPPPPSLLFAPKHRDTFFLSCTLLIVGVASLASS
eukprot:Rhum_TRINITY_DN14744_c1_g1::Rhum_TRINITY_DN14744_c1_g1_i1::g.114175::m.114175